MSQIFNSHRRETRNLNGKTHPIATDRYVPGSQATIKRADRRHLVDVVLTFREHRKFCIATKRPTVGCKYCGEARRKMKP